MTVEHVKNRTTQDSPVTYEVTVPVTVFDLKQADFESTVGTRIRKAINGLED